MPSRDLSRAMTSSEERKEAGESSVARWERSGTATTRRSLEESVALASDEGKEKSICPWSAAEEIAMNQEAM